MPPSHTTLCCNREHHQHDPVARAIFSVVICNILSRNHIVFDSLQGKLTLGYLVVAVLTLAVSLFTFDRIRVVEQRVLQGERVTRLFDVAMEIRRFERNFFLHGQEADFAENARYVETLRMLLKTNAGDFRLPDVPETSVQTLGQDLDTYQALMAQYAGNNDPTQRLRLEPHIRKTGQDIVAIAEEVAASERVQVNTFLHKLRFVLLIGIVGLALLMVAVGQALSRSVVRPLRRMVGSVGAAQQGRQLDMPSNDREIVAIIQSFNQILRELERRQQHLMRSEKLASLGTMLSGVAHELNNPLSNIWSSCQILEEEIGEADIETKRRLLRQIDEQTERARVIVRSLLDFARDRNFKQEALPLRALVEQTIKFLKGQVPQHVHISLNIPDDIVLHADRQRMQQALLNLIKNAVEATATSAGEVTITGRAIAAGSKNVMPFPNGCSVDQDVVDIAIADNGPGIPAEVLPRIFDPFFTTKDVGQGMGLGLSIVHQIIEEHGGCIFADNEPAGGAIFHIRMPLQPVRTE